MGEETNKKVKSIVGLYSFYKHQMSTPQRIALLTLWIEVCEQKEEYEVAAALQQEMNRITSGEEDYVLIPPVTPLGTPNFMVPTMEEMKRKVIISMEESSKKKKLNFVNLWGTGKFVVFNLTFGDFKFILFNIGVEVN